MKTELGDVPYFEGYKYVGYQIAKDHQYQLLGGQLIVSSNVLYYESLPAMVYEKAVPKRFIFEEIGGGERPPVRGEWYVHDVGEIKFAYVNVSTPHMIVRPVYSDEVNE